MKRRFGKPTTRGYVFLALLVISVVAIVVGVVIGGATGVVIDAIAGGLLVFLIFALFPSSIPRRDQYHSRDEDLRPPGRGEPH